MPKKDLATFDKNAGFILLHRSIRGHWIWEDPTKLKWWLDILMECNHEEKKVAIGFQLIECKRGQTINSMLTWAKRWRVNKDTVRRFFDMLKVDAMISTENVSKTTRLTVCNYGDYNDMKHDGENKRQRSRADLAPIANSDTSQTNNELNNELNNEQQGGVLDSDALHKKAEPKPINIPFEDFWNLYDKKRGDKNKLEKKWNTLTADERTKAMKHIPQYIASQPEKQFRKDPQTYVNNKSFNDEIITSPERANKPVKPVVTEVPDGGFNWSKRN